MHNKFMIFLSRFNMLLKLFIAMGLTWLLEIIAFAVSQSTDKGDVPEWVSILLIIPNVVQGIIIFLVFGIKPSNREHIKKRYFKNSYACTTQVSSMNYGSSIHRQNSTNSAPIIKKKSVSYSPCKEAEAVEFLPGTSAKN